MVVEEGLDLCHRSPEVLPFLPDTRKVSVSSLLIPHCIKGLDLVHKPKGHWCTASVKCSQPLSHILGPSDLQ